MKFMYGCNYWDSVHGTDMWRCFDEEVIRNDARKLSELGVRYMRVFPNWRDFQPINKYYSYRGSDHHGYYTTDENDLFDCSGIDYKQIENFKKFANICNEYNIKLMVSVVTGWMSGRLFLPHALEGKNPISDPEVLMWMAKFIKGFVENVKDCENIVIWDLGNECNSLGVASNRYEAFTWTAFVRNAILAADNTRPISSGMHSLEVANGPWLIQDQGEIVDYMTPHPYPSPSIKNDIEPINRLRTTLLPTVQCAYYSELSGKPAILQEQGCFSPAVGCDEMQADFAKINLYSSIAYGVKGYFWWCGMNHNKLNNTPYTWSMLERDLGLLKEDNETPKPVAYALKEASEKIESLPFEELPDREIDGLCLLAENNDTWGISAASHILAKQAGLDLKFFYTDKVVPKSPLYILPCIQGWNVMPKQAYDSIINNVYEGSTLFVSYEGSHLTRFEELTGLRSLGMAKTRTNHKATLPSGEIDYYSYAELILENIDAEIIAVNEENNIVLSKRKLGKGEVYFLNFALEHMAIDKYDAFNNTDYYKVYQYVLKSIIDSKPIISNNPNIGVTLHKLNENKYVVIALNYSNTTQECGFNISSGWKLTPINDSKETISKCNASFFYLER